MNAAMIAAALLAAVALPASAQTVQPKAFTVISPVFGQLITFSMSSNFAVVYENTRGTHYTREAVPKDETAERWTEMITITGEKGVSASPNMTPEKFAGGMAAGFKRVCPDSFGAKALGDTKFGGANAFVVVVGCGAIGGHSETALIAVMKGSTDFYTIQWAERGPTVSAPPVEDARWVERLRALQPIALCAIVPGEAAPYPSCIGRK
jgi:hypothetical protein